MLCKTCGVEIKENDPKCPNCGFLNPDGEVNLSQPSLGAAPQKSMPFWFKLALGIAILGLLGATIGIFFTESLVDVVDDQIEALRQHDIDKAYKEYTSKSFQETTSLEKFRAFIEDHPQIMNSPTSKFTQRSIDHNIATIRGELNTHEHEKTPIEFKLIREDKKWKILSIRLLKKNTPHIAEEAAVSQSIIEQTKLNLKALQEGKIAEVYEQFMSEEFKTATTKKQFQDYVKRYPIFNQYKTASFYKPKVKANIASLSVILQSQDTAAYLKIYLIFDGNAWKIWSMRILSPEDHEEQKTARAARIKKRVESRGEIAGILGFGRQTLSQPQEGVAKLPRAGLSDQIAEASKED